MAGRSDMRGGIGRLFNRGFAAATRVLGVSNFIREHAEQRYPVGDRQVSERLQRRRRHVIPT